MTMCCSVRTLVLCAVTLCYLWGCGLWVECWQTGAGGEVEVVRVGIILEDREIDQQLVEHELQTLSQSLPHNIKIEPRMIQVEGVDPYEVVRWACVLLHSHFALFLSISSCASHALLSGLARDKRVPHLAINHHCPPQQQHYHHSLPKDFSTRHDPGLLQGADGEEWDSRGGGGGGEFDFSFPLVVDTSQTVDVAVAQIVKLEKWTSFVVVHDEWISPSRVVQFMATVKRQMKDLKYTVVYMDHQSILNEQLQANGSEAGIGDMEEWAWGRVFDRRLRHIFEEDAKDYFNFILLATLSTTTQVITRAERLIEERQMSSYNWILANQELTIDQLRRLNTRSKIVALSRIQTTPAQTHSAEDTVKRSSSSSSSSSSPSRSKSALPPPRRGSEGAGGENEREVEYLLDGLWVVRDLILTTAGQIDWQQVSQLECSSSNTATFKDGDKLASALRTVDIRARSGSVKFMHDRLKVFIELDIWATNPPQKRDEEKEKEEGEEEETENVWEMIGRWDVDNELQLKEGRLKPFQENYFSVEDLKLRIVTIVERPFIIRNEVQNGATEDPNGSGFARGGGGEKSVYYTGCCVDILNAIQKELRNSTNGLSFQYEMYEVADNKYGIVDPHTNKWNGLIGDILQKKADMAVAGMIRNYEREIVVDFSASYMDYGVSILISKPHKTNNVFGFLKPLTVQVWISICVATFLIGLLLFVLSQLSPFSRFNLFGSEEFNFNNAMWFALASLMQQGGDATPVTTSGRILGTFWWFFSLIIVATYTANLAAFLTVTRMETPIESLEDLASQHKMRYGTVADSSLQYFFRDQAGMDQLYERIWTYMSETEPTPMVRDEEEGLHLVLNGEYAFLWDDPVLQFHRKQNCHKLQVVGKPFNKKNYAFAVPKGAPYRETITLSILRLQESGELDKIKQKWFESSTTCTEEDKGSATKSAEGIELDNVAGVFYILGAGAVVSLLTCVIEYVWFKYLSGSSDSAQMQDMSQNNLRVVRDHHRSKSQCLDGEVILNRSAASLANRRVLLNGGPKQEQDTSSHIIINNNNNTSKQIRGRDYCSDMLSVDPLSMQSEQIGVTHFNPNNNSINKNISGSKSINVNNNNYNNNRRSSISPAENNQPPYLDYLPLKNFNPNLSHPSAVPAPGTLSGRALRGHQINNNSCA